VRKKLKFAINRWSSADGMTDIGPHGTSDQLVRIVDAAAGMTLSDITTALRRLGALAAVGAEEVIEAIQSAKKVAVRRSPALELVDMKLVPKIPLAGMNKFRDWLRIRQEVFEKPDKALQAGIDRRPKGVLLLGIPGTGKSLAAKAIARDWSLPLIRLDMGAIQDKWVGSSEERIRTALSIVEAIAPCVLWIDEIDKGLAQGEGSTTHSSQLPFWSRQQIDFRTSLLS
jgi:hypothetical protein